MDTVDVARQVIEVLNDLQVEYMVVGSLASNVYGVARNTEDADIVIETDEHLDKIQARLADRFFADPQTTFETVQLTTKHALTHQTTGFRVELFLLSEDEHDKLRFSRRTRVERDGFVIFLPTPEDVIIQKLRWRRAKDVEDASNVIEVQADSLDWSYILAWCGAHDSRVTLNAITSDLGIDIRA